MDIQLIIFDFDGTLGDTRRNIVLTMQQTMQAMGLPVADEAVCAATIGLRLRDCFLYVFPNLTSVQADECVDIYHRIFEENKRKLLPQPFPHVCETLERLASMGVKMSVASSRTSVSLRELLVDMGIDGFVSYIVGAEDVNHPKPNPEPVLKTLEALGVSAGETLVVGDMPVDIFMGAAAGCRTCGVTYGNASRAQLEEAGADFIIDDIGELLEKL